MIRIGDNMDNNEQKCIYVTNEEKIKLRKDELKGVI